MSAERRMQVNRKDVVFTHLGHEGVILNLRTKYYFSVNETGLRIWELLEKGLERDAIVARITEEFAVEPQVCAADVDELLARLAKEQLIA